MATYLGSLVELCCGEGVKLEVLLACVGSVCSGWTTLCLQQPRQHVFPESTLLRVRVITRTLSQVGPAQGNLPDPGIELMPLKSPELAGGFFITSATWWVGSKNCMASLWRVQVRIPLSLFSVLKNEHLPL